MHRLQHAAVHHLVQEAIHHYRPYIDDLVDKHVSESQRLMENICRGIAEDPSVLDIIDLNVKYLRKGGWAPGMLSGWSSHEDKALVLFRLEEGCLTMERVTGDEEPYLRDLVRQAANPQPDWLSYNQNGNSDIGYLLTPVDDRRGFPSDREDGPGQLYPLSTIAIEASWKRWRFDFAFDVVDGQAAVYRTLEHFRDQAGDQEAPWTSPSGNGRYAHIRIKSWSLKNAHITLR